MGVEIEEDVVPDSLIFLIGCCLNSSGSSITVFESAIASAK
jgi:hypothetical protein